MCGRSAGSSPAPSDHCAEAPRVGPDLEPVGSSEYRLQRRKVVGRRPVHRQHPFGMIARPHADRQIQHVTVMPAAASDILGADTGKHQDSVRDPIAPAHSTIRSADQLDGPSGPMQSTPTARPRANLIRADARVGQQGQIGPVERGLQVGASRPDPCAAVDVQRHRADSRRDRLTERRPVEIRDPRDNPFRSQNSRKMLCSRRIQTRGARVSGRQIRAEVRRNRVSVSMARKCGSTSAHDQPGNAHLSKSSGSARQK